MTQAEWVYYTMMGEMEIPFPGVEDEFAEGTRCEGLYREIFDANMRLCERLGVEEDTDVETMINHFFSMNRELCMKMYECGVRNGINRGGNESIVAQEIPAESPKKTVGIGQTTPGGMNMIGMILGEVHLERGLEPVKNHRWVQVKSEEQTFVAVDPVKAEKGETVLLISGDAARMYTMDCPGQWVVAAVLGVNGNNG